MSQSDLEPIQAGSTEPVEPTELSAPHPATTSELPASPVEAQADNQESTELLKEFMVECYENLDQLNRDLLALEQEPDSEPTLASIFRTVHTIKGTCGLFGFQKLEAVTHVGENLLGRLRDGQLQLSVEMVTVLLDMADAVREMLGYIEIEQREGPTDYAPLIANLVRFTQASTATPPSPLDSQPALTNPPAHAMLGAESKLAGVAVTDAPPTVVHTALPEFPAAAPAPRFGLFGDLEDSMRILEPTPAQPSLAQLAPTAPAATPTARFGLFDAAEAAPAAKPNGTSTVTNEARAANGAANSSLASNTIRVDVGLLDVLMNLVGELVLARNQILQYTAVQAEASLTAASQRLNLITTELQEGVMKTRMQPIGNIWNQFPRVVRDLALACNKKIRLETVGKETEMDKTIIEAIKDPLTHLVRNAADHGIEPPQVRLAQGKPAEGRIYLRAYHEGGQVNIEISDDGAGIDPEKVRQRALQRGLITAEQAARMSDREAINLIFLPGFSTAEKVTNLSGRGVGMDVVKTNIEKISGSVDIQSKLGQGSTIKIKIPLTLAIIPALMITSGGDRYAIPQVSLLELVRLEGQQARTAIELIYGAPVYRLRGNLLPLAYLNRELRVEREHRDDLAEEVVNIVVLRADDRQFGLVVDEINDTEEIVVKPLGKQLKGITCFAGATIMGDGKVALILDVLGLAQHAKVVAELRDRGLAEASANATQQNSDQQALLLFRVGESGRMALPLALVARLEEFPPSAVERAGQQEVVQYRGQIMPLIRLAQVLNYAPRTTTPTGSELLQVVVYTHLQRSIGLVVDEILDIVEDTLDLQHRATRPGLLGSAVIQQRVTDVLDIPGMLQQHDPAFREQALAA